MVRSIRKLLLIIIVPLMVMPSIVAQTFFVQVKTNFGNMKVMLYDDTPGHRDEFLRLVNEKHFDGTLFYRSVKNFVIQGGSSDSRNAPAGKHIGYGEEAVNIDSEFSKQLFHKKSHPIKYFYILILTFKCVKDMSIFFLYDKNKIVIFNNYFRI